MHQILLKGYELEIKSFGELFEMEDKKEGVSAFFRKKESLISKNLEKVRS